MYSMETSNLLSRVGYAIKPEQTNPPSKERKAMEPLTKTDPEIAEIILREEQRQRFLSLMRRTATMR